MSKRLNDHYLSSYEKNKKHRILVTILRQVHKNKTQLIKKLYISRRIIKKKKNFKPSKPISYTLPLGSSDSASKHRGA